MTDLLTSPSERQEFRLSVRRFLAERSTEADVRRLAEDERGYDPDVWKQLGSELGLLGLLVPEEQGGQGLTPVELVVALEESGRALLCAPLLSSAVLTPLALQGISSPLLASVADSTALVAVALEAAGVTASGGALTGQATNVLDAHLATTLLVVVGSSVYEVRPADVTLTTRRTLDLTMHLSTVELSATPATLLGQVDAVRLQSLAALAAAAHLVGIGAAALELAVTYAKTREQFGKPIGAYQGVKHLVAEMHARLESARAAVMAAAVVSVTRPEELAEHASIAKAWCSSGMVRNAEDCVQVMGGIGFTWEHPAHLYLRRAKVYEQLFGDARTHRRQLAASLGLV